MLPYIIKVKNCIQIEGKELKIIMSTYLFAIFPIRR